MDLPIRKLPGNGKIDPAGYRAMHALGIAFSPSGRTYLPRLLEPDVQRLTEELRVEERARRVTPD